MTHLQDKRSSGFELINFFDTAIDLIVMLSTFFYWLQAMFITAGE